MARNPRNQAVKQEVEQEVTEVSTPETETAQVSTPETETAQVSEPEAVEVSTTDLLNLAPEVEPETDKEGLYNEIKDLVARYSEHVRFAEFNKQGEVLDKINVKIEQYQQLCESECFAELRQAENPLFAAARKLVYTTYAAKEKKDEFNVSFVDVYEVEKIIDPLRLHKSTNGGVGYDKQWYLPVQVVNFDLTAIRCIEMGINPKHVNDSFAMSEEARKLANFKRIGDDGTVDMSEAMAMLRENAQIAVDAMIGPGYAIPDKYINYLRAGSIKKNSRKALSLSCTNNAQACKLFLEICNGAIDGTSIEVNFKAKKSARA